jgi:hypothetical protein
MKKIVISLSFLSTLMFAANYADTVDMLANDAKVLNDTAMSSLDAMTESKAKLSEYETKLNKYADEVAEFSQQKAVEFTDTKEALQAMNGIEKLSSQSVVMAKELMYLSSHQADNASDDYKATLKSLSKTALRLSDDIGKMSDRILVMADKIGVMADRIVQTQKIQSKNLNATLALVHSSENSASLNATTQARSGDSNTMQSNSMQENGQTQNMAASSR